ncbi:hypothetical protein DLJ58_02700 [Micromonospora arida]|uniref:Uncharacterized protein n=1 Tax=Micromonospora arida TaxID=2203715 RepID=A0A3N9XL61_9ACTN|nr:hypothetical protein DLJ58_02700 [Micromonospora arida]
MGVLARWLVDPRNAVDQTGSDKLDVRIGGLHVLWRIAEPSAYAAQSASRRTVGPAAARRPRG